MPQKTNLNISPYYDDFNKEDNFYRMLFKPGFPVQARELTGLQSILQNQVEQFGSHIFKEGSMVIPGGITYDNTYYAVKVNPEHLGIDITVYLDALIKSADKGDGVKGGARIKGQDSKVEAKIVNYVLTDISGVDDITIFVKYTSSGTDSASTPFANGETLALLDNVTYGNTTLNAGDTILTAVATNATSTGSAVHLDNGVYFLRGTFVSVPKTTIILEPYTNTPSYRVGLDILEEIITSNDDSSINDNAKGFTNYAAPGADRFKITVKLAKKSLTDFDDTNFVELLKVSKGEVIKLQDTSTYSEIRKYFAKRTYEESGNYSLKPFKISVANSLNDEVGNGGLFIDGEKTVEGNTPSDDLMGVKVSAGTAYVRGYDIDLPGSRVIDVDKPRDLKDVKSSLVPFRMGNRLRVNNVHGVPLISVGNNTGNNVIKLFKSRRDNIDNSGTITAGNGLEVGQARVYAFQPDQVHDSNRSADRYDLYLFDVQTYTVIHTTAKEGTLNTSSVPVGSYVQGLKSGATGYLVEAVHTTGTGEFKLSQTSGTFIVGEQVSINDDKSFNTSISKITQYTTDDIKSVWQNCSTAGLQRDFVADTDLSIRVLPRFSASDLLSVSQAGVGTCGGRLFGGNAGISTGDVVAYNNQRNTAGDPTFNVVSSIASNGSTITLDALSASVPGVCEGRRPVNTVNSKFGVGVPKFYNMRDASLYAEMPKRNIGSIDLSDSNLTITHQLNGLTISSNQLTIDSADITGGTSGIGSCFFTSFDEERYSIHLSTGDHPPLNAGNVILSNGNGTVTFTGLTNGSNATAIVTVKKVDVASKSKDFTRSATLSVTRTSGVNPVGLTTSQFYGLRVEDREISLNVPDVVRVHAVYESTGSSAPSLDKLNFVSGLSLNTNTFIGEKIVGKSSRAIAQLVTRDSATKIGIVYLNSNKFEIGESITFEESNITANLQTIDKGDYIDKTRNYKLDKGHRSQYCDYSRIVRNDGGPIPSRQLLIIFDHYTVQAGDSGDVFTVNSYTKDRYTNDIAIINGKARSTDIIDFRPRVSEVESSSLTASPFGFDSRTFENTFKFAICPNEDSQVGYKYYLPRIDKVVINTEGEVEVIKGTSEDPAQPPVNNDDSMEIAEIRYPPYLYNPLTDPKIVIKDNRRFTMRDIGALEKRIKNLEVTTSLSLLEMDTKSLQVTDPQGINRFKTGFVVDNFANRDFIDSGVENRCDIDIENKELISAVDNQPMAAQLALHPDINPYAVDWSSNLLLLDQNIQKTGDLLTLKYTEELWIEQTQATQVENVNPFNVVVFVGGVTLDPPSDNWVRTIYIDDHRTESTGAQWVEQQNTVSSSTTRNVTGEWNESQSHTEWHDQREGTETTTRLNITQSDVTTTREVSFENVLEGPSREFDYIESIKISGDTDPFMRSRNVYFAADGLKPFTKHYHFIDNQANVDIFPKLIEITMTSGSFQIHEHVRVFQGDEFVGYVEAQAPSHKFGDTSRPDIGANLGALSTLEEKYTVDPYDRDRPAPADNYSVTSKLFNCDCRLLGNATNNYFGRVVPGCKLVGQQSGATATVDKVELIADNWGDIIGTIFFRDPNQSPQPPVVVRSGTKTFKVTAAPQGTTPLPGSTALASTAVGTYSGSGTILTQDTVSVSVRNPERPPDRPNQIITSTVTGVVDTSVTTSTKTVYRDPLAQSFRAPRGGCFLTSFDIYFGSKDPNAKVFWEIRTVELGIPTNQLVQNFAKGALNPANITTSTDASVATNVKLPSPLYLEGEVEYALVLLAPSSDLYEMWCATMGQKTVKTANLPDVQNVVVSKQFDSGSLFKSQNGTIWTPSQYQDLTFTLYKAKFGSSGTATFYNSDIDPRGTHASQLDENPVKTLPRKLKVKLSNNLASNRTLLKAGTKISQGATSLDDDKAITGIVEKVGGPIDSGSGANLAISDAGLGYATGTGLALYNITSNGSAGTVNITGVGAGGKLASVAINGTGSGYCIGDILGITTATSGSGAGGYGAILTVESINNNLDTLYLTDVQGEQYSNGENLIRYNGSTRTAVTGGSSNPVTINGNSVQLGDLYSGKVFEVTQRNHGHHGANNKIKIEGLRPDTSPVALSGDLGLNDTVVSVANTGPFSHCEGISTNRGYALIGSEIVNYTTGDNSLTLNNRGLEGSPITIHSKGDIAYPYTLNGMSLVGINTTHDIPTSSAIRSQYTIDKYYLEAIRSQTRTSDETQVSFTNEKSVGGGQIQVGANGGVGASNNLQFSVINPQFNVITPGKGTNVNAQIRTISGTSAGGNEVSFIDQGFQSVPLNRSTFLSSPRMVASKVNEAERLTELPKNKSLTLNVAFSSANENLSPVMDVTNAHFVLGRNKINNPISDYSEDSRVNKLSGDPHGSLFVSKRVNLKLPATSLQVLIAASRPPQADFRVLYKLFKADSSDVEQNFVLFPGYDNLTDTDDDGYGDRVIKDSKNSGRADAFVPASLRGDFSEYQFTADNLDPFNGFVIKIVMSSTNESAPVRFKDFRAIALA